MQNTRRTHQIDLIDNLAVIDEIVASALRGAAAAFLYNSAALARIEAAEISNEQCMGFSPHGVIAIGELQCAAYHYVDSGRKPLAIEAIKKAIAIAERMGPEFHRDGLAMLVEEKGRLGANGVKTGGNPAAFLRTRSI